ncbi:tRNA-splicing endonuclease subunit SEN54-like isoform X2 [Xenia sp. Carnegie-2017]|uniref:tRNA-splicing endonuclease subunit SEN54-like isoform X2 n=1 Tax=Xenia sp. Carnegie-2017 TaxID=2897299 RepID=UPI001F03C444|nr:tRNA-splicing endonuclease subunit SEN54-like isoform X2 [Xenia sp. Carnegie-2017]
MQFHESERLQLLRRNLMQTRMPCRGGPKDSAKDDSEEQTRRLEDQLEELDDVLSEQRVLRKGNISVGHWNSEKQLVEISIVKGVHWNVFGKMIGGQLVLLPEEALYLLDHGLLEIYYNKLPISVQQGYELFLSDVFPLHHYVVYCHLRNLGFIVFRHEKRVTGKGNQNISVEQPAEMASEIQKKSAEVKKAVIPDDKNPAMHYWNDDECCPLVHPNDATSLENILDKLQIIKGQTVADASKLCEKEYCRFKITYNVYQPQKNFKKSDPGLPNHCICVCRFCDSPPTIGEMNQMAAAAHPVPLKYAVVEGRDVSFYSMLDVQLPTYFEKG